MQSLVLATIDSPPQSVWHIGDIPIRAYAICILIGAICAIILTSRRYVARGGRSDTVIDAAIIGIPFGIVGARAYHVITDNDKYFCDTCNPWKAFKITDGGLGIMGAVILGFAAIAVYMRVKKLPIAPLADAAAPGIILAQGIGRLGNYFNQELYGRPTDVPWGLKIFWRVTETGHRDLMYGHSTGDVAAIVHPTFLYELLWNVLGCLFIIWLDKKLRMGHGRVFALYVLVYGVGRFWVELMRADPATHIFGLRVNTITSAVLILGGLLFLLLVKKGREKVEDVSPFLAAPPVGDEPSPSDGTKTNQV